jgi:hypothetical protein
MTGRNDRTERPSKAVKPHASPSNRIPFTFDQAIDVLLSVDPKTLSPAVRPATPKAKRAAKKVAKKKG